MRFAQCISHGRSSKPATGATGCLCLCVFRPICGRDVRAPSQPLHVSEKSHATHIARCYCDTRGDRAWAQAIRVLSPAVAIAMTTSSGSFCGSILRTLWQRAFLIANQRQRHSVICHFSEACRFSSKPNKLRGLPDFPIAMQHDYILTLSCPDRTGIVYRVSGLLFENGCNILDAQQYGDEESGRFFLRVHFDVSATGVSIEQLCADFAELAETFSMDWQLHDAKRRARLLVLVSRQGHCLNDLLFRTHSGQLAVEIAAVVSNHRDFESLASSYGVPFHYLPIDSASKARQEQQILELVERERIDLVVLARYMQILSPELCEALAGRAINIHHSFLPSFKGARPYHQAHARGVKIIGATAHYVTSDLDEGPIIEQDVARVDHSMTPRELVRLGSDTESQVLARAVRRHVEHRILLNGHRTVVFR
jgi:formyltetrahydrofolate deformylase